jgi:hypothetical protein
LAPAATLKVWVTWSELMGCPRITLADFRSELRKYPRNCLLLACARMSVLFNFGPEAKTSASEEITKICIPLLFPPHLASRVSALAAQDRVIFFQSQLRFLAAEVMRLTANPVGDSATTDDRDLGGLLLRAAEMLYMPYAKLDDPREELLNILTTFLPVYELDQRMDPLAAFLRFYIFLTINIERLPPQKRLMFDVHAMFEQQFGFTLKRYCQFVYVFLIHAMSQRQQQSLTSAVDSGLGVSHFKYTQLSAGEIKQMFDSVSVSVDQINDSKAPLGFADFDYLRDHPYLRQDDVLFCLDYEFAVNKIESGALWRILRTLKTGQEKDRYLSFWGHVFEDYVAWLFETYAAPAFNEVYPAPLYVNSTANEICDVILICGSTAILIEAKLATCPSKTRYSGDRDLVKDYLEEKLVADKGVAQLVKAIDNIVTLPPSELPSYLHGIKKLMPVIVTRDEVGSGWKVNTYLNVRFQEMRKRHRRFVITPLVSMNIATLEKTMGALSKTQFQTILEDRIRNDRDLGRAFDAASTYVHRGMARNLPAHIQIVKKLSAEMSSDFHLTGPAL